jgi:deazaflavin-dependent oxidoreductase (nitroreductase family)
VGLNEWNQRIMAEFRANHGRCGGDFEGAPMIIIHHVGRTTGTKYENPLVYQPGPNGRMYLVGSYGGAPKTPAWFGNLVAAGQATVEVGDETFEVKVIEITGAERDEVFAKQKAAMPVFAEYEQKTVGVRTIPILALDRV